MPRLGRTVRRLAMVPVFAVAAALAIALVAWGLMHTRYGQEELRRAAVRQLDDALPEAGVEVERASFALTGDVVLHDVVLALDGVPAVSVGELHLEVDLVSLLSRELRVTTLRAVDPFIDARLDLARLAPRLAAERSAFSLVLDRVAVEGGTVVWPDATLTDVHLEATVDVDRRLARIESSTARWREHSLGLSGWLRELDGVLIAGDVRARVDGVEAELELGSFDPASGAIAAAGQVRAPADRLLAIAGAWLPPQARRWRGDLDASVAASRAAADAGWELTAAGTLADAPVAASVRVEGADLRGRVRVAGARPAELVDGAPEGVVDALVSFEPGAATVVARGVLADIQAERFEARARGSLSAGEVVVDVTDRNGVIHAELSGERHADGAIVVHQARLQGDVSALLDRFATRPVQRLVVDARAVGPTTDLLVSGDVRVEDVRHEGTRARSARATLRIPHVSLEADELRLSGTVDATAHDVELAGRRIARGRAVGRFFENGQRLAVDVVVDELEVADQVRGEVVIDRGPRRTSLRLGQVFVVTGGLGWSGRGGRVVIDDSGRVAVDDLDLASSAGTVHVHGVLDARRARHKEGRLLVELRDFDLHDGAPALARIGHVEHPLAGTVDAEIALGRRGAELAVEGAVEFRGLVWRPGAAAADGSANVSLRDGWLSAVVRAAPRDYPGEVRLELEAAAPLDTMDTSAWRALDLDDLERAELVVDRLEARVVEAFIGQRLPIDGTLEGRIAFPYGDQRAFDLDLGASGVAAWRVDDLAARFRGSWDDRRLSGRAEVAHAGEPVMDGEGALECGFQELWRRPLLELGDVAVSARATMSGFDLRRVARAGVVDQELAGWVDAELVASDTLARPKIVVPQARVAQLSAAGIGFPRVELAGEWQGEHVEGRLSAEQATGGALAVEGELDWAAEPRVVGTVTARAFGLRALRAFATEDTGVLADVEGVLDAELTVDGPTALPKLRGNARARQLGLLLEGGTRRVEDGVLNVRFAGYRAYIERLAANTGRGRVAATGSVNVAARTFELDASVGDLPIVVRSYVAAVDAEGTFSGRWIGGGLDTRAELRSATVRLADTGRALQDIGPLEDVVYVERIGGPGRGDVAAAVEHAIPLQVRLVTLSPVYVTSPEAEAWMNVDVTLHYQGILDRLEGEVVVDRGRFKLFERNYQIATAIARLDGSMPIDPELDIELRRTFPYAIVSIFVTDHLADPRIQLRSDNPDYSDEQVLAIILGQDPDATAAARSPGAQAGGVAANIIVGRIVRDALGLPIDIVRTHPDGYEIGKYLFRGAVLVGYRSRTTEVLNKNRNEGTIEWRLRRDVVVEGSYGDSNVGAADVLYVIRF